MSKTRLDLQAVLEEVLGSRNVYYQPPASVRMKYPAIVYLRDDIDHLPADNLPYLRYHAYQVIVIDPNPDSVHVENVSKLPRCRFERHYTADNLNHDVFTLYF